MRISHEHKFIFFANPKTGSESLRDYLNPISDIRGVPFPRATPRSPFYSHMRPVDLKALFEERGWDFNSYYRFLCVRNPWARLVSLYLMLRRLHPDFVEPFGQWLVAAPTSGGGGGARMVGAYSLRNFIGGDFSLVDDVFKTEDMDKVPQLLAERGLPVTNLPGIKRLNARKSTTPYYEFYTNDLRDMVSERYREEIELFGYKFGE